MATHSTILPGEFHGQRSLEGYSPWGHKKSGTTEQLSPSPSDFSKLRCVCQAFFFSHQLFIGWGLPQGGSITLEEAAPFTKGNVPKGTQLNALISVTVQCKRRSPNPQNTSLNSQDKALSYFPYNPRTYHPADPQQASFECSLNK